MTYSATCSVCGARLNTVHKPNEGNPPREDHVHVAVAPCPACLRILSSVTGAVLLNAEDSKRVADATIEAANAVRWQFENSIAEVARHFLSK